MSNEVQNPLVRAFRNFFVTYRTNDTNQNQNNGLHTSASNFERHTFNQIEPIDGFLIKSVGYETQVYHGLNQAVSSTVSQNIGK